MSVMDAGAMNQTGAALLWRGLMLRGGYSGRRARLTGIEWKYAWFLVPVWSFAGCALLGGCCAWVAAGLEGAGRAGPSARDWSFDRRGCHERCVHAKGEDGEEDAATA